MKKICLLLFFVSLLQLVSCQETNQSGISTNDSREEEHMTTEESRENPTSEENTGNGEILEWPRAAYEDLYLVNTFSKLNFEKKLTVGFLGGSVTAGAFASSYSKCWAGLTGAWLRETYPDATIRTVDAGWGGTGIEIGTYRLQSDLLKQDPDLVFVEFAVNDYYRDTAPENVISYAESVIWMIHEKNPTTEVVFVLVGEKTATANLNQRNAYQKVADAYHIPVIDLCTAMQEQLRKTNTSWEQYFADVVHPNDNGYAFYAEQVKQGISACFEADREVISERTVYYREMPKSKIGKTDYSHAQLLKATLIKSATYKGFSCQSVSTYYYGACLTGSVGAELTVTFEGTDFALLYKVDSADSKIECQLDGGDTITYSGISGSTMFDYLYRGLENGKHTIKIKITAKEWQIQALAANGSFQ